MRKRTKLSIVLDPLHVRTFRSFRTTSISFVVITNTRSARRKGFKILLVVKQSRLSSELFFLHFLSDITFERKEIYLGSAAKDPQCMYVCIKVIG